MMIDDNFDDIISQFNDMSRGIGIPHNDTNDAIVAMLYEYVVDYETTAKWVAGCVLVALDKVGRTRGDLVDALTMIQSLPPHELAIVTFENLNGLLSAFETKDGRHARRKKG